MNREELKHLIRKVDSAKESLEGIRRLLVDELSKMPTRKQPMMRAGTGSSGASDDELIRTYSELRQRFREIGAQSVEEFAGQKTAAYLDRFVTVNGIPISTKQAKSETLEELANYLARSMLIRGS